MADEDDCLAHLFKLFKFMIAFRLKKDVPYGQRFIHDQNFRIDIDCHRESQAHKHTAGIGFYRLIHIVPDICKLQDRLQFLVNLLLAETDHGAVQVDILDPVIFTVKSGAQLQQRGNTSIDLHVSSGRIQNTRYDLQDRGFPGTIGADDPHTFPLPDRHIDPFQGVMLLMMFSAPDSQRLPQPVRGFII